ncbi:hypothetical protein [Allobaculum stercoricanis]|uniref:hypothetical protein n=1 Tax=Allobaculum stercoricanis TaxID=174709 RepID=UPI00037571A6|nr:hypothetical protein [Allobaculum stercoricanis]
MPNSPEKMKLFYLCSAARNLRAKMMRALHYTLTGQYDTAIQYIQDYYHELKSLRSEYSSLAIDKQDLLCKDVESSLKFSELVCDSIMQANCLHSKNCSAVKFHIYN